MELVFVYFLSFHIQLVPFKYTQVHNTLIVTHTHSHTHTHITHTHTLTLISLTHLILLVTASLN